MVWDHQNEVFYAVLITSEGSRKEPQYYLAEVDSWEAKAKRWGARRVATKIAWVSPDPGVPDEHNGELWSSFATLDTILFPLLIRY